MADIFRCDITDRVAMVTFDLPESRVNILNREAMEELDRLLDTLRAKAAELDGAVILSGKDGTFVAGADLATIEAIDDREEAARFAAEGQRIFDKLAGLPFPVVAAIHGACLGGGLELALACSLRVVSDHAGTFLGLPETQLGIIPGFGGTQRLPRLVGLIEALTMITTGGRVFAAKAVRIGLADSRVAKEHLAAEAIRLLRRGKHPGRKKPLAAILLESNPLGRKWILDRTRKALAKKSGDHYPAVFAAVRAVETGLQLGMKKGLALEARLLGDMAVTAVSRNLLAVFRLRERFRKAPGRPERDESMLGVIGTGVMGGGIGALAAEKGLRVRLIDTYPASLGRALLALAKDLTKKRRKGIFSLTQTEWIAAGMTCDTAIRGLRRADLVIEAVAEDMAVKKEVFTKLAAATGPETLLLTNTSSLSVTEMAQGVEGPERIAGLHFFNPVDKMVLVEIIRAEKTSATTVARLRHFTRRLGKLAIEVKDRPGFLVNRLLFPYLNEAARLLEEGADLAIVDRALLDFGMPMGAFLLLDMVGLDIAAHVGDILHRGLGDRMTPSPLLAALFKADRLGRKNGRGFYRYDAAGRHHEDRELKVLLAPHIRGKASFSASEIVERLLLAMINEAAYCLTEEVAEEPAAVDAAMVFGTGFPPYTGGPLRYADSLGTAVVVDKLVRLEATAGERFRPAELLRKMLAEGSRFYP